MDENEFIYRAIGLIYSPFDRISGTPIQPPAAKGSRGRVELHTEYQQGLKDLEGFSHLILVYHFHRVHEAQLRVVPFLDDQERGIFATRAPMRPNPLGISVVRLMNIEGGVLLIEDVDVLNRTPLLDIKPYVPYFDQPQEVRSGWLEKAQGEIEDKRADDRFR